MGSKSLRFTLLLLAGLAHAADVPIRVLVSDDAVTIAGVAYKSAAAASIGFVGNVRE